jgi:uncharacterized protein YhbP (UPF0306 family)
MNLPLLAKQIVEQNEYLTLATVGETGAPWVSILAYTYDGDFSFYFASLPDSRHAKEAQKRSDVSFSIFDSRQDFGTGVGLQIEGTIETVGEADMARILELYYGRKYPYGNVSNEFMEGLKKLLENKTYLFYKLTPKHVWINDPTADTDRRVEVNLKMAK